MDISLTNQISSENSINRLKESSSANSLLKKKNDEKALKEACQGFEEIFLNTMLKTMRSTVQQDGVWGKSHAMDIYTSLSDQYLAEKISKGENSTGVGEYLYRQLQSSL